MIMNIWIFREEGETKYSEPKGNKHSPNFFFSAILIFYFQIFQLLHTFKGFIINQ
jgi:hypothetical protein